LRLLQLRPCVLAIALATATGLACAAGAPDRTDAHEPFVTDLSRLINEYRLREGLPVLDVTADLGGIARHHSEAMAEQGRLSHDGFRDRFVQARSRICVENVARNFRTPQAVFDGWRHSPAHHRNLLEPKVSRMAIAASARYVTFFACR
jgi:uncharacterized protein YkwD